MKSRRNTDQPTRNPDIFRLFPEARSDYDYDYDYESRSGVPIVELRKALTVLREDSMIYQRFGKRLFDLVLGAVLLVALIPLFVCVVCAVFAVLGRPIFFFQERPGIRGELFRFVKFRSMAEKRDKDGAVLSDEQRLGKFGRFLRTSSLDEIPELFHVVSGKMSLVGPRPLLPSYVDRYTEEQARRMEVRPGITGWAQINGRNEVEWEERFAMDVWYVDHVSLRLDLKILILTIVRVFQRRGINASKHVTMEEFMGSDLDCPNSDRKASNSITKQ
ncbi:MAG: sugar transferase [Verrucomicrobiota bacterium]